MDDLGFITALRRAPLRFSGPGRLDAALDRLGRWSDTLASGNYAHAPMAVEALDALGLDGRIPAYLKAQDASGELQPATTGRGPVHPHAWRRRLGDASAHQGWTALFEAEIADRGWRRALTVWVDRLSPAAFTAAAHPFIRTGHAVRALSRRDTPARRRELARALASWAVRYRTAPWSLARPYGEEALETVAADLAAPPAARRAGPGAISTGLQQIVHGPEFTATLERVDLSGAPDQAADRIVTLMIDQVLDAARSPFTAIVHCHAVTAVQAARSLAPFARDPRTVLMRGLEIGLALRAVFADLHGESDPGEDAEHSPRSLALRAADSLDDHAIKFVEATLAHHSRTGVRKARLACDPMLRLLA